MATGLKKSMELFSMHEHPRRKPINFKYNHQVSSILAHSISKVLLKPLVTKINKFCSEDFFLLQLYTQCKTTLHYMILNEINIKMNHTINT